MGVVGFLPELDFVPPLTLYLIGLGDGRPMDPVEQLVGRRKARPIRHPGNAGHAHPSARVDQQAPADAVGQALLRLQPDLGVVTVIRLALYALLPSHSVYDSAL